MIQDCPNCGQANSAETLQCVCGYHFTNRSVQDVDPQARAAAASESLTGREIAVCALIPFIGIYWGFRARGRGRPSAGNKMLAISALALVAGLWLGVLFYNIVFQQARVPFAWWFPVFVVVAWVLIPAAFSLTSGWSTLARRFRCSKRPEGEILTRQVDRFGYWRQKGAPNLVMAESGLYLYHDFWLRFMHPPLLIPWSEVRWLREIKFLWWRSYEIDLAGVTTMRVRPTAIEAMREYLNFQDAETAPVPDEESYKVAEK
jgi:hypothetical protein